MLAGGSGRIELRGEVGKTALLVEGRPIVSRWPDGGSIGHELFLERPFPADASFVGLRDLVAQRLEDSVPLSAPLLSLLSHFTDGEYDLDLDYLADTWDACEWEGWEPPGGVPWSGNRYHYPNAYCGPTLVYTLPFTCRNV